MNDLVSSLSADIPSWAYQTWPWVAAKASLALMSAGALITVFRRCVSAP